MMRFPMPLPALALLLAGCDGAAPSTAPSALALAPPAALTSTRAVDRTRLRPRVSLADGRRIDMVERDTGRWSGTIALTPGRRYTLEVLWIETIGERALDLASLTRSFTVGADGGQIDVSAGDYDLTLDRDGDGVPNLAEREAGTDPFTAPPEEEAGTPRAPPGRDTAQVLIPRIAREDAPRIDGLGVELDADGAYLGEWAAATRFDTDGNPLAIDRFMVDGGTDEADGRVRRRWAAVHDGDYLYVLVVVDDEGLRFRDSDALWNDDSVELYLDGDNSKSAVHDEDDVQRSLPLVAAGTQDTGVDEGIVPGFFLSPVPIEIDFATGPGLGPPGLGARGAAQDVYELRVGLASANIVPERPFGFELQVNDDDDGGTREGKWGWAHPARVSEDTDLTFFDPSFMGVAVLD